MLSLKNILVPHDFSEASEAALAYAADIARLTGAKLHLLHVSDKARLELGMEYPLGVEASLEEAMRERLLRIMAPREQAEFRPELQIRSGVPHAEIIRYVDDYDIDLIVMGTHGRGFVAHAVMGSVAEKVVRHAPCPVLTVRDPRRMAEVAVKTRDRTITVF